MNVITYRIDGSRPLDSLLAKIESDFSRVEREAQDLYLTHLQENFPEITFEMRSYGSSAPHICNLIRAYTLEQEAIWKANIVKFCKTGD